MLGMLVIGGAFGSLVLLVAAGVVDLPFLHGKAPEKARPQGVPIPLSARAIPAYTQVVRDHFMDAKTLDLVVAYFSPEDVEKNGFLTVDKVLGHRVLANDKGAGYAFKEKDFLPPGTKPGMAAGVPSGNRSYLLDALQVDGVSDLKIGDLIDVLSAVMVEFDKTTRQYHTVPTASNRNGGKKG